MKIFTHVKSVRNALPGQAHGAPCPVAVGHPILKITYSPLVLCSPSTYKNWIMDAKRHILVYPLSTYGPVIHHSLSILFWICLYCVCLHNLQKSTMHYIKKKVLYLFQVHLNPFPSSSVVRCNE